VDGGGTVEKMLSKFEMSDTKKIGTFLLFLGIFFLVLGTLLLLDRKVRP